MTAPPPHLRDGSTPEERALLSAQLSVVVPVDDAPALLDPRGRRFQRLEWLGDSVLDVLVARHRAIHPDGSTHADLTSDRSLAARVADTGLPDLLDWQPGPERLADLVEAAVAVGHRAAGWFGARTVAVRLVSHDLAQTALPRALTPRQATEAGASVLEVAASLLLFARYPAADEGELSRRREPLLSAQRLSRHADGDGSVESGADRLQAELGRVLVVRGEQAAVEAALPYVRER
ncbi:MAG: hypothetical protein M3P93_14265 [Actinomycetota bacterium]|nr:hypothetical protein [Actinomycetota bacterium]